ncbi:MAG: methyltransferase [Flavobacteriales bacterium]|nr:methyltransferase [Flavobacteriales bacterium]
MDFISDDIMTYAINHTQDESNLLKALNKETHQKILQSRMISGHFQGRVLSFISQLIRPETILEIGTYTGYATLCLAEGLTKNGKIHTIEINEELIDFQKKYFDQSKFKNQIFTHIGDAIDIIPKLKLKYDLIFLDADKANYPNYMEMVVPKLKRGGVLVADNVLWNGKVLDYQQKRDDIETKGIKLFSELVKKNSSLQTLLLPIRDGLMMCRKI